MSEVKDLVLREPDPKKRANLLSIAMTIACRYMDKNVLKDYFKEEMEMLREASIVEEWLEEGVQKGIHQGVLQNAREAVIENLEVHFDVVPTSIVKIIKGIDDPSILKVLHKKAATVNSLEEFKGVVERALS